MHCGPYLRRSFSASRRYASRVPSSVLMLGIVAGAPALLSKPKLVTDTAVASGRPRMVYRKTRSMRWSKQRMDISG